MAATRRVFNCLYFHRSGNETCVVLMPNQMLTFQHCHPLKQFGCCTWSDVQMTEWHNDFSQVHRIMKTPRAKAMGVDSLDSYNSGCWCPIFEIKNFPDILGISWNLRKFEESWHIQLQHSILHNMNLNAAGFSGKHYFHEVVSAYFH